MASAGTVTVDFAAETAKFTAELKKVRGELSSIRKDTDNVSRAVSSAVGFFKGFVSAGAVLAGVRAVIRATAEAEAAQAQLNNALTAAGAPVKAASAEFQAYASQLQRTTTFNDEAIMQVQTLLLSFKGLSGQTVKDATAAVLDLSTRMGIDAPGAAKLLGKALSDPEAGLTALKRAGVAFTESQKDQIKAMQDAGDLAGAQGIVLKTLEDRFGGAAAAARNTFGGALAGLKNQFGDLLEGGSGINAASDAVNKLTEVISSPDVKAGFGFLISALSKVIEGWALLAGLVGEAVAAESNPALDRAYEEQERLSAAVGRTYESMVKMRAEGKEGSRNYEKLANSLALYRSQLAAVQSEIANMSPIDPVVVTAQRTRPKGSPALDFTTGGEGEGAASPLDAVQQQATKDLASFTASVQAIQQATNKAIEEEEQRALQASQFYETQRQQGYERDVEAAQEAARKRESIEQDLQSKVQTLRAGAVNAGIGLLQVMAQKSKTAAKALILINKGIAINQAVQNTAAAVTATMASNGGMPWAAPAVASVKALGAVQIGLIAATGALELGAVSAGSGGSVVGPGTPNNPIFTQPGGEQQPGVAPRGVVQLHIHANNIYGAEELRDYIAEVIREDADRDVVYFPHSSRQAMEIRGSS